MREILCTLGVVREGERIVAEQDNTCQDSTPLHQRRTVLIAACGFGLGLPLIDIAATQAADVKSVRPQEGDRFVFFSGDKQGEMITPADLPLGGPSMMAYPMDPTTKVVRDGSRLNQILLVRLNPADLAATVHEYAAEGIVAYSAICRHQGCPVAGWQVERKTFQCPCHGSEFDPKDKGRVLNGPAVSRLAMLPLKIIDGVLTAAAKFSGRVGVVRR